MNFLDLQNLVAYWVDDLNFGYFTPVQVKRFLNNAAFEVQKRLVLAGENYYLTAKETPMVQNQADYILPDDFLKLNRVELIPTGQCNPNITDIIRLNSITLNQRDFLNATTGVPNVYYLRKNRLIILPVPDATAKTIRLWYTYRIIPMTLDSEIPDVPEEFQELIAILAAKDCLLKDGRDVSTLLNKEAMYEKMFESMAEDRKVDAPRTIVERDFDLVGYTSW